MKHLLSPLLLALAVAPCAAREESVSPQNSSEKAASSAVHLSEKDGRVEVTIAGKPFTTYHFTGAGDEKFVRPYCFPVLSGTGVSLTSDQLTSGGDHPHHRSLWVSHGEVNGVDHWSHQAQKPAKQRHVKFTKLEGDTLVEELEWEGKDEKPMLRETRTLRFFADGEAGRGIDLTVALTPADGPVTFGDTKEAGLCSVRVAKAISDKPTVTNAAGQTTEAQTWGKPAKWCDISGMIDGRPWGVAVLDHPANPRHPSTWHVREYGLMSANIFGLSAFDTSLPTGAGAFTIDKGKTATFRYRVLFHPGDAKSASLDAKFDEFAK